MNKIYIVGNYVENYETDPGTWEEHSYHATLESANIVCEKLNELREKYPAHKETNFEVREEEIYSLSSEHELDNVYRVDLMSRGLRVCK